MTLCSGRTIWKESRRSVREIRKTGIRTSRAGEYASALSSFLFRRWRGSLFAGPMRLAGRVSESVDLLKSSRCTSALEQMIPVDRAMTPQSPSPGVFLAEALSAYEMVYRGFRERNAAFVISRSSPSRNPGALPASARRTRTVAVCRRIVPLGLEVQSIPPP